MSNNPVNLHVGQQLRKRRIMLGMSQEAIGRVIGMAPQQVQKYEKGTNVMNAVRLYEFAQSMKVPVAYFYDGLEKPESRSKKVMAGFAEDSTAFERDDMTASDREGLELLKSYKRIRDKSLRKKVADLVHMMAQKDL